MVCITATGWSTHATLDGDKTLCGSVVHEVRAILTDPNLDVYCRRCQKSMGQVFR